MKQAQLAGFAAVAGVAWYATRGGSGAPQTEESDDQQQDTGNTAPEDVTDEDVYPNISGINAGSLGGGLL